MQPPPFESPQGMPKKKSNALPFLIIGGVLVCCLGPIALLGGGGLFLFNNTKPLVGCTMAMTGLSRALGDYADANGGKLPPADKWQTALAPYYEKALPKEDMGPFNLPSLKEPLGCGEGSAKTAFKFNSEYGGKKLADIEKPSDTLVIFETSGPPTMNGAGVYKDLGKAASPKIFSERRGWFAISAALEAVTVEDGRLKPMSGGGRRFRARTGTGGTSVEVGANIPDEKGDGVGDAPASGTN